MHSVGPDNGGSPKKRSLSRGISEDESLRSFIQESENSSRRLTRSDSRAAALRKKSDSQQSEQDSIMGLPEMLELQASHDELVQELRGLEVERETLLFQVDVLQDTLEGVEELLAEAQREAGQASVELEQEKQAKMKLEKLVRSLMQEVEGLKKERNTEQSMSSNVRASEDEENAAKSDVTQLTGMVRQEESGDGRVGKDEGTEGEGSSPTKVRWMVNKPPSHTPSLALGHLCPEDGVHQRPCAHSSEDARDSSPDRSDSDNISNYEDAPGETPELDRVFPGDSNQKEDAVGNVTCSQSVDGREPGNNDSCVLS